MSVRQGPFSAAAPAAYADTGVGRGQVMELEEGARDSRQPCRCPLNQSTGLARLPRRSELTMCFTHPSVWSVSLELVSSLLACRVVCSSLFCMTCHLRRATEHDPAKYNLPKLFSKVAHGLHAARSVCHTEDDREAGTSICSGCGHRQGLRDTVQQAHSAVQDTLGHPERVGRCLCWKLQVNQNLALSTA